MADEETPARKYPFVVNNRSDEAAIEKALAGLRTMAKLGRKAQAALDALEHEGCYDKVVILAETSEYDKTRIPTLRKGRFPRYRSVSREDLPGLADLTLSLGHGSKTQYGGHSCVEYVLSLSGMGVVEKAGELLPHEIVPTLVGQLRVSSRAVSYLDDNSAWFLTNKMKRLDLMLAKVAESGAASRLAINIRRTVVTHDDKQQEFTQRGLDLWRSAEDWIRDDGHSLRLLRDAIMALHCKLVMDD